MLKPSATVTRNHLVRVERRLTAFARVRVGLRFIGRFDLDKQIDARILSSSTPFRYEANRVPHPGRQSLEEHFPTAGISLQCPFVILIIGVTVEVVLGELVVVSIAEETTLSYDAPVTSAVARALGAIRPPSGGDGRERQRERQKRERGREAGVAGPGLPLALRRSLERVEWMSWSSCSSFDLMSSYFCIRQASFT
ncbi:hypothetical protein EYF80_018947 [Liparis tanakae]|uniref:Uncharacterized protein n=1 Tax=Liparis tanakae TaxID=230148 RepID=A0A4Z2I0Q5_9TELE|nr:hypothetical protein EYF80_018947 [Liparis tanakae]